MDITMLTRIRMPVLFVQRALAPKGIIPPLFTVIRGYAGVPPPGAPPGAPPGRTNNRNKLTDEQQELRLFLFRFTLATFPRSICKTTFSRSSGPGGQNVNKYDPIWQDNLTVD
jgi:hypothetical protein